jgi:hypothetical protein
MNKKVLEDQIKLCIKDIQNTKPIENLKDILPDLGRKLKYLVELNEEYFDIN